MKGYPVWSILDKSNQMRSSCSLYMWSPDPPSRSKIRAKSEMHRTFSQTCLHSCDTQLWPCTPTRFSRDDCWFPISSKFRIHRRDLWVVVKSASVEMNVHSWQGLVAGTCGHQTRYLDQRSAQNPKCIVLLAKMSLQDFTTSSGQKDLMPDYPCLFWFEGRTGYWSLILLYMGWVSYNWGLECKPKRPVKPLHSNTRSVYDKVKYCANTAL